MNRPSWMLKPIEEYEQLPLEQIALQLSRLNRYAGAVEWSVLQHSLLVWDLVKNQSATAQVWALLHDAAECWIGDALLPAKQVAGLAWSNLEDTYNGRIQRLAAIEPDQHELMMVADADKEACRLEIQWMESDEIFSPLWELKGANAECVPYWLSLLDGLKGLSCFAQSVSDANSRHEVQT